MRPLDSVSKFLAPTPGAPHNHIVRMRQSTRRTRRFRAPHAVAMVLGLGGVAVACAQSVTGDDVLIPADSDDGGSVRPPDAYSGNAEASHDDAAPEEPATDATDAGDALTHLDAGADADAAFVKTGSMPLQTQRQMRRPTHRPTPHPH